MGMAAPRMLQQGAGGRLPDGVRLALLPKQRNLGRGGVSEGEMVEGRLSHGMEYLALAHVSLLVFLAQVPRSAGARAATGR